MSLTTEPSESAPEPVTAGLSRRAIAALTPDEVCAAAADIALTAAVDIAGDVAVGEHLGVVADGDRVVTHHFACRRPGYRGWHWAVTVTRVPRSKNVTVSEVVLLPGADAVLAPVWLAWSDRLRPGDLGATDQLPFRDDDPLLEPGFHQTDDDEADQLSQWELGLGRTRVLSRLGRDDAAMRWYRGPQGPGSEEAIHSQAACWSCGYLVALGGSMRQMFGVCANEWSPSDGKVVSLDHGCGAHSETDVEKVEPEPLPAPILDEFGADLVVLPPRSDPAPVDEATEDVPADDVPADDVPAVDVPAADVPAADVPVEGVAAEDVPAGDLVAEIAPERESDSGEWAFAEPVEIEAAIFEPGEFGLVDPDETGPEPDPER